MAWPSISRAARCWYGVVDALPWGAWAFPVTLPLFSQTAADAAGLRGGSGGYVYANIFVTKSADQGRFWVVFGSAVVGQQQQLSVAEFENTSLIVLQLQPKWLHSVLKARLWPDQRREQLLLGLRRGSSGHDSWLCKESCLACSRVPNRLRAHISPSVQATSTYCLPACQLAGMGRALVASRLRT